MKRVRINPISKRQRQKNEKWQEITNELCQKLEYRCQYCGRKGHRRDIDSLFYLDGHHFIKRSLGGTDIKENCYLAHRKCHTEIEAKGIILKEE